MSQITKFFRRSDEGPGASDEVIRGVEAAFGVNFPEEYKEFLREFEGYEGRVGNSYAVLWSAEILIEMNQEYCAEENTPGLLYIGTNGAGEIFAFDKRTTSWPVVMVACIAPSLEELIVRGESFIEFIQQPWDDE